MKKKDVINDVENITAPSNRRLSVKGVYTSINLGWSIDRVTIVGKLNNSILYTNSVGTNLIDFEMLMNLNSDKDYLEKVGYQSWQLVDSHSENIAYIEMLKFQKGMGRIDFNPNKISEFLIDGVEKFIHKLFIHPHFSRADIACDIVNVPDSLITQYVLLEPVSCRKFHDKKGKLETVYWGSRSSEKQIRMYNKKVERKSKGKVLPDNVDTWWRLEFQLRRDKATNWKSILDSTLDNFSSPMYIPEDIKSIDRVIIYGLLSEVENWSILSRPTRYKYRNMIQSFSASNELTLILRDTFDVSFDDLRNELDSFLRGIRVDND